MGISEGTSQGRRTLLALAAGAPLLGIASLPSAAMAGPAQPAPADNRPGASAITLPVVFDALGEIRTVYDMALVDQILAGGTQAIAITLTDPKAAADWSFDLMLKDLAQYNLYFREHATHFVRATGVADIARAQAADKLAVFYNLQDSSPVGPDLDALATLRALGVTSIQLTYNTRNAAGQGCFEEDDQGVTAYGRQLLERMAAERMLVDLSHAGMRTMADAIAASPRPVIISHTACKALRAHRRNTTDANMRAIADRGGVVGITQIRTFLTDARSDNLESYFDHVMHATRIAGIDHVGIGSDRDHRVIPDNPEQLAILLEEEGAQVKPADWPLYLDGLNGPRRMEVVRDGLRRRGMAQDAIDKVMGNNVYRLYRDVIG